MKKVTLFFGLIVVAQAWSMADTIGWWRMDSVGGALPATLTNSVNPGVLDATVGSYNGSIVPLASTNVARGSLWTSVGLQAVPNLSSAAFTNSLFSSGGVITVNDDPARTRSSNVTVECLFKVDNSTSNWRTLVIKSNQGSAGTSRQSWALRIDNTGKLFATISPESTSVANVVITGSPVVTDGKWHHAALTVNATNLVAKLYLDYQVQATATLSYPLYYADFPISIGANLYTSGCFDGWIDDVRVSDVALDPALFLLPFSNSAEHGLIHYSMEPSVPGYTNTALLNVTDGSTYPGAFSGAVAYNSTVVSPYMFTAQNATQGATNSQSLRFTAVGSTNGGYVAINDANNFLVATNFTVELFFRTARMQRGSWLCLARKPNARNVCWAISLNDQGRIVTTLTHADGSASAFTSTVAYDDGVWHHVALSINQQTMQAKQYIDYTVSGSFAVAKPVLSDGASVYLGGVSGGSRLDGWIDEFRISREALEPAQFLTTTVPGNSAFASLMLSMNGTPGMTVVGVTNLLNGGSFYGTAASFGTNAAMPVYASDRVAPVVYSRAVAGTAWTNTSSISFAGTSSTSLGGRLDLFDSGNALCASNFTAELFVKMRSLPVSNQVATLIRKKNARGTAWGVSVNASGGLETAFYTSNTLAMVYGSAPFADGKWHHLAVTYSATNRAYAFYFDYVSLKNGTLTEPLLLDGGSLSIGAAQNATWPFDGLIDEVRITDRVLSSAEFLSAQAFDPYVDGTVAYWDFEEGVPGLLATNIESRSAVTQLRGVGQAGAGAIPLFSDEAAASPTRHRIFDGRGEAFIHVTERSVKFTTNRFAVAHSDWLCLSNITVEAFVKVNTGLNYAGLVRKNRDNTNPSWAVSLAADTNGVRPMARIDTTETMNHSPQATRYFRTNAWDHLAVTFQTLTNNRVQISFYVNYEPAGVTSAAGQLQYADAPLYIGGNASGVFFDGWLDEVRISNGILTTNQFLRARPPNGSVTILR